MAGRKRKAGNRHPCGKLKPEYDRGGDGVLRRIAIYAPIEAVNDRSGGRLNDETHDAIGRAMVNGLLASTKYEPKVLCDAGRDYRALAYRIFGLGMPRDSLARYLPQSGGSGNDNACRALEGAYSAKRGRLAAMHPIYGLALGALLFDPPEADHGPAWLDRLIFAQRKGQEPNEGDVRRMQNAVVALEAIA